MRVLDSRPKCPSCYGEGTTEGVECQYCFGQMHDPYYTGQQENDSEDVAGE